MVALHRLQVHRGRSGQQRSRLDLDLLLRTHTRSRFPSSRYNRVESPVRDRRNDGSGSSMGGRRGFFFGRGGSAVRTAGSAPDGPRRIAVPDRFAKILNNAAYAVASASITSPADSYWATLPSGGVEKAPTLPSRCSDSAVPWERQPVIWCCRPRNADLLPVLAAGLASRSSSRPVTR